MNIKSRGMYARKYEKQGIVIMYNEWTKIPLLAHPFTKILSKTFFLYLFDKFINFLFCKFFSPFHLFMKNFYESFISSIRVSMIHNRLYENLMGFSLEYLGNTKGPFLFFYFCSLFLLFIYFLLFLIFCKKNSSQ